jgi:hypothetical protein
MMEHLKSALSSRKACIGQFPIEKASEILLGVPTPSDGQPENNVISFGLYDAENRLDGEIWIACAGAVRCGKFAISIHDIPPYRLTDNDVRKIVSEGPIVRQYFSPHGIAPPSREWKIVGKKFDCVTEASVTFDDKNMFENLLTGSGTVRSQHRLSDGSSHQ